MSEKGQKAYEYTLRPRFLEVCQTKKSNKRRLQLVGIEWKKEEAEPNVLFCLVSSMLMKQKKTQISKTHTIREREEEFDQ